jgi:EthD domain-containing protein
VQTHTLDTPANDALRATRGGPEGYDGVAELWWDSLEDLMAGATTPEGHAAGAELLEDERRFIDLDHSPLWIAEEHEIIEMA